MANFDKSGMTQQGINLMGKAIGGATIQFTKLVLGDGEMKGEILDLQGVVSAKQNVDVTRIERKDNQCTVGGELLTSSVKQGFFWRECGLYAMDPDVGEILYNYAYSTKPDYIASSDSGMMEEILVSMVATVGSNANVDVTIDSSMVFATKKVVDNIQVELKNNEKISVNFITKGGKVNDITYDSTILLQELTDFVSENGGGTINFPPGKYYFKGTYIAKAGVTIEGAVKSATWNGNASIGDDIGTVFYHVPDVPDVSFIKTDINNLLVGYAYNINLKNLYIIGSPNSKVGLHISKLTRSNISDLILKSFDVGIQLEGCMNLNIEKVSVQHSKECCILITGNLNTTLNFNECYVGQCVDYLNSVPLKIDKYSILNASFTNLIVESCEKGISIDSANVVSFINLYTENVPATTNAPTIEIGMSQPPSTFGGITNFTGGIIQGTNSSILSEGTILKVDYCDGLTLTGITLQRSGNVIKNTLNSKGVLFAGSSEVQITKNLYQCNTLGNIAFLNCTASSTALFKKSFIPWSNEQSLQLFSSWTGTLKSKHNAMNIVNLVGELTVGEFEQLKVVSSVSAELKPSAAVVIQSYSVDTGKTHNNLILLPDGRIIVMGTMDTSQGDKIRFCINYTHK